MEASNRRSCGVSFILVDTAIIVKERLNRAQCLTIQPPMLKHSQGQVPGYIPQQTGYYVTTPPCVKRGMPFLNDMALTNKNCSIPYRVKEISLSMN